MNLLRITEELQRDENLIYQLIESLGYEDIRDCGDNFRFKNLDGDSANAIAFYKTGYFVNFTRGMRGDAFAFVMYAKQCNFVTALNYIVKTLHLNQEVLNEEVEYPFGGFYRKLIKTQSEPESDMPTYDESILSDYSGMFNTMFFKDGISFCTQAKYKVGYDVWSNRITIPEYTFDGRLCGIMGRLNDSHCNHEERWLPLIPCSRNLTLFGYHRNYATIQQKNLAVIFESEKSTMQMNTFGSKVALSSCGCHLSNTQVRYLKALMVNRLILAYDEGLDEEYVREEAKKLKMDNQLIQNKVGYIYDREHDILKVGTKASPSDLGKKAFSELMKRKVVWL